MTDCHYINLLVFLFHLKDIFSGQGKLKPCVSCGLCVLACMCLLTGRASQISLASYYAAHSTQSSAQTKLIINHLSFFFLSVFIFLPCLWVCVDLNCIFLIILISREQNKKRSILSKQYIIVVHLVQANSSSSLLLAIIIIILTIVGPFFCFPFLSSC